MKKYLLTAVAALAALSMSAQETVVATETVTENRGADNWFISIGAGPQVFMGDHDRQAKVGDLISPALDISVGKWFSPVFGVRLMYSGLSAKGATQTWGNKDGGVHSTGKELPGKFTHEYGFLCKSKFNFMDIHADVMFDITNLIRGYKPDRIYGLAPYVGIGWGHVFDSPKKNAVMGSFGLFNMFHITSALDINLDARMSVTGDDFDGEKGDIKADGLFSLTAGVTYRFPSSSKKTTVTEVVAYDNEAVNELRGQVNELKEENKKLEEENKNLEEEVKQEVDTKNIPTDKTTVINVNGRYLIYFPINVSKLSEADCAQLEEVANIVKSTPASTIFNITGYADKSTGTPEINERLSRERAQAVRAYLVKEFNIPAERFNVSWNGGVDDSLFGDAALSRVVVISQKK